MSILTRPTAIVALLVLFMAAALVGGPSNGLESQVMRAIAEFRAGHPAGTGVAAGVTNLGGAYVTLGLTVIASLWLLVRHAFRRALLLAGTVLVERSSVEGLKDVIARPRPNFGVDWLPHS